MQEFMSHIKREIQESIAVKAELVHLAAEQIAEAAQIIVSCMRAGGKLIAFGNGGSAADAQHAVAELVGRYLVDRKPLAAIALTTNSSSLTAISNDYGFAEIFSRQLEAIGKTGDVALALSTSGNSPNVLSGLESARKLGLATVGLTGKLGGKMRGIADVCIQVPSHSVPRIQEAHALIIHILCGIVESSFVTGGNSLGLASAAINQER
jgi:D-sedoheptulose 7-phosphate isomerase